MNDAELFEFPEVRVVEASAGSGKTYALAKRYVQLLLNPSLTAERVPIGHILALTFTNKAAFEMKERILDFLKRIALGQMPSWQIEDMISPLGISFPEAQKKSFAIMEDIIRHYNFFQVQTIDKFINALLSGCSFKIGLTANFKIKTNIQEYLLYSLDQLIDRATNDKDLMMMFEEFLHHYLYLENRNGWFPKEDMLSIITALFMQNNSYGLAFAGTAVSSQAIIKNKSRILADMKTLRASLPEGTDARFLKSFEGFLKTHEKSFDIDSISDYFAREYVPVKKNVFIPDDLEKLWEKIGCNLRNLCEEESKSLFNPYVHIYKEVLDVFYVAASKDDILFLSELNKKAATLFDEEQITVEELYYRLATRFHHYLVDEFQDTSVLQWHNLRSMIEEGLSTGGSLFYVGDKKQAIYGFRGGDAALFEDVKKDFVSFNVQTEHLTKNWRSHKAVVEFNNSIFNMENLRRFIFEKQSYEEEKKRKHPVFFYEDHYRDLENVFGTSQQLFREEYDKGYVQIEHIHFDKKEETDAFLRERILKLISELKERFAYKDIAILTRGNKDIEEITNWLLEAGIQVESERTSNVKENYLIGELIAFLNFLNSPINNGAFVDFIVGDLFSQATGISSSEMHDFVFGLRNKIKQEKDFYVYREFRVKYPEIWETFINEFFNNVGLYPLYELLVSFYSTFFVLKSFPQYQGFFMHFLEMVKNEEEDHADIVSFLEYFDKIEGESLFVHTADVDAIRILTIHKSKGLEFPVVILPYLGMNIQVGNSSDNNQSYILHQDREHMGLRRLKSKYYQFSDDLYALYADEYRKSFMTELNNVYVAVTRPQCELYGFVPKKIGNSFNFVNFLIPPESLVFGKKYSYTLERESEQAVAQLSCSQHYNWIDYLKEEFADVDVLRKRVQRVRGDVLHGVLAGIKYIESQDIESFLKGMVPEIMHKYNLIEKEEEYVQVLQNFLNTPEVYEFFNDPDVQIFTEKEVINVYGHIKRIDRLIITDDRILIIDFKSSHDGDLEYQKQVNEYMSLIRKIYPQKTIQGFLVYFDHCDVCEVVGDRNE